MTFASEQVRAFVFQSLTAMNLSTEDIDDDTVLGPAGADLDSLALAELAVRVEDQYGVKFSDDESEQLAAFTVREFCDFVAPRVQPARA